MYRDGLELITAYIPGKPVEEVRRELGITGRIIKMASNENPLGPSPRVIQKMAEALQEANLYPEGDCPQLREVIAKKYCLPENHFIFGTGVDNLIPMVINTFVNSGDEVIIPAPSFAAYRTGTIAAGGIPVMVPLKDFTVDLKAMLKAVTPKTKMVFICNPNNPTGTIVHGGELTAFLEALPENLVTVLDEAYCEYVEDKDYPDSLKYVKENKNVVVFRTFSKIYGLAGLRVGYGITRPEFVFNMNKLREPFNVNRPAQAGAIEALSDDEFVEKGRLINRRGKQIIYKGLDKLGLKYIPTEANFIFADLGIDMEVLFPKLLKKGIIIRPAAPWGYPSWARITIGLPEECEEFIKVLGEVLAENE